MDPVMPPVAPPSAPASEVVVERRSAATFFQIGRMVIILVSFVFVFLGFLCQVSGVGKANKQCKDDEDFLDLNCADAFRYDWWTVFFQLLVMLGVAAALVTNTLKEVSMGVSILMAVSIAQMIITAEKYLDLRNAGKEYKAAAAGYILATMGDMLLALVLGVTEVPTIQMVRVSQLPAIPQGLQIWQRRQPQQQPQSEMMGYAQPGGQMVAQQQQAQYFQNNDQGYPDTYAQPVARGPVTAQYQSPQERFQNLSPHLQGQQQQYGPPPPVPPPVRHTDQAHT